MMARWQAKANTNFIGVLPSTWSSTDARAVLYQSTQADAFGAVVPLPTHAVFVVSARSSTTPRHANHKATWLPRCLTELAAQRDTHTRVDFGGVQQRCPGLAEPCSAAVRGLRAEPHTALVSRPARPLQRQHLLPLLPPRRQRQLNLGDLRELLCTPRPRAVSLGSL